MIIIADAGATKTEWCAATTEHGCIARVIGEGINFSVMSRDDVFNAVKKASLLLLCNGLSADAVFFYGAGIVSQKQGGEMEAILGQCFPRASIFSGSDLLAASKALWGDKEGITAILGTGSNSCFYDGKTIVSNIRPGGFILGDEGSGAALGKMLLSDFVKGIVPAELSEQLQDKYGLTYESVVENIYRGATPSRYLASFAPFVLENSERSVYLERLAMDNFRAFIKRCLLRYFAGSSNMDDNRAARQYEVGVVGGFGYAGRELFECAALEEGIHVVSFLPAPMDALIDYHLKKWKMCEYV